VKAVRNSSSGVYKRRNAAQLVLGSKPGFRMSAFQYETLATISEGSAYAGGWICACQYRGRGQELVEAGCLKLQIYAIATVNSLQHPVDERLRLDAFKVMADGLSIGHIAATRQRDTSNRQDDGVLDTDGHINNVRQSGLT